MAQGIETKAKVWIGLLVALATFFIAVSFASAAMGEFPYPHVYRGLIVLFGTLAAGTGIILVFSKPDKLIVPVVVVAFLAWGIIAAFCCLLWWIFGGD